MKPEDVEMPYNEKDTAGRSYKTYPVEGMQGTGGFGIGPLEPPEQVAWKDAWLKSQQHYQAAQYNQGLQQPAGEDIPPEDFRAQDAKALEAHRHACDIFNQKPQLNPGRSHYAEDIDNWFEYHAPTPGQTMKYERIRAAAKMFARVLADECPVNADTSSALRTLRQVVMIANASIACEKTAGHPYDR